MHTHFLVQATELTDRTDVLCLQECGPVCLNRIEPDLRAMGLRLVVQAEGQATFVKEEGMRVVATATPRVWAGSESKYCDWRVVACCVLAWAGGTSRIVVANNHTHDGSGLHKICTTKNRDAKLQKACQALQAVAEQHGAVPILVGDHNLAESVVVSEESPTRKGWSAMPSLQNARPDKDQAKKGKGKSRGPAARASGKGQGAGKGYRRAG